MVKKEFSFSDGTRIFYQEVDGETNRFIAYSYTPKEIEKINGDPLMKKIIDEKKIKVHNAGKYYYLAALHGIVLGLNDSGREQLYGELKELHDKIGRIDESNIINKNFLNTFGKYWKGNNIQCAAFFATIYLAMLDMEEGKRLLYPNSMGKSLVLKSCEAVILKNTDPRDAATMFERKKKESSDDYDDMDYDSVKDSPSEKYNGYNGFDDKTIDDAFEGIPEATWNID